MNTDFLNKEEGLRLTSYQDQAGKWTIGFGSRMYQSGKSVGPGETITLQEAEAIRDWEINNKSTVIKGLLGKVVLNDNQMTAIVSLTYNIGVGGFSSSSLLKVIKKNPNDLSMVTIGQVTDNSIHNWMYNNKLIEINIIKMCFMLWNKITDPKTGRKVFDIDLFLRRIREGNLYFTSFSS